MGKFYAVCKGRNPGIYMSWNECKKQVNGFSGSVFKSFSTELEAQDFVRVGYGAKSNHEKSNTNASAFKCKSERPTGSQICPGIDRSRNECKQEVDGLSGSISKSFAPQSETQDFVRMGHCSKSNPEKSRTTTSTFNRKSKRPTGVGLQIRKGIKRRAGTSNARTRTKLIKLEEVHEKKVTINDHTYLVDENDHPVVFTDGACSNNGKKTARAGYGVFWGDEHPLNVSKRLGGIQTNQRAEIAGINACLMQAKANGLQNLKVKTDSQFVINCVTKWAPKWIKNNWVKSDGQPVVHKNELIVMLDCLKHVNVNWEHVRGHTGIHGNEMADRLAVAGMQSHPS